MRDRLVELQQKAQELSVVATENTNPFSVEDDDDDSVVFGVIKPQAVVFEEEPVIQDFLSEVEHIQDDIAVLETEVKMTKLDLHLAFVYLFITRYLQDITYYVINVCFQILPTNRSLSSLNSKRPWWQPCVVLV